MGVASIFSYLKEFVLLGISIIILFLIGYFIIYKKLMKGTKIIDKKKMILYGITIIYLVIVFGATFLTRGNAYKEINLHLFSSYREAWNNMSDVLFSNIVLRNSILNILLFIPLGFLLPIYSDKLKKIYKVLLIGLSVTLIIEIIQYVTNMGIFEIDDIFNNTLGVLIGFCVFMIFNNLIKKENRKYIFAYVLPFVFVIGFLVGFNAIYQKQELGNLPFDYTYKINLKDTKIECNAEFSKESSSQSIYQTKILTKEQTRDIAQKLFEKNGTSINLNMLDSNEEGDTAIYYSKDHKQSIWIDYKGGKYRYNTGSQSRLMVDLSKNQSNTELEKENDEGQEGEKIEASTQNGMVQELDTTAIKIQDASREEIKEALENVGIEVPDNAKFEGKDGTYTFTADMITNGNTVIDGTIRCSYYIDKTLDDISNNLITYEKVMERQIITEEEAYKQILEGKFNYSSLKLGKIKNLVIENVKLDYVIDTKGYYVPVYVFAAKINNEDEDIIIKATN